MTDTVKFCALHGQHYVVQCRMCAIQDKYKGKYDKPCR